MKLVKQIIACLLLLSSIGATSVTADPAKLKKVTVSQFGQSKFLLYLPLYIAIEQGFTKAEGLDVNLVFAGNDDQVFASVASGSADFGVGDPVFSAVASERGFKSKTVALMITRLALFGYTKKADQSVIEKVSQLSGLRVGTFPSPSTTYTFLSNINNTLPADGKMTLVEGAPGTQLAMLNADKADFTVDLEPTVSIVEDQGYRVVFDLSRFSPEAAITGLTVTQRTIDSQPEVVQGMVNALAKALAALHKDHSIGYETAFKIFPDVDKKTLKRAVDRMLDSNLYPVSVEIPDAAWQTTLKARLDHGDLHSLQPLSQAVDNSFAVKASQLSK